jgi:hypothetical protein
MDYSNPFNRQDFQDAVRAIIKDDQDDRVFGVVKIPIHQHTGLDSARVSFDDLTDKEFHLPFTVYGADAATAANYKTIFILPFAATLTAVREVHATAGTDGGSVTLQVEKLTGTTAPGSGTSVLASAFNLKSAANTVVTKYRATDFVSALSSRQFAVGDRVALLTSGTLTSLADVSVVLSFAI